MWTYAPWQGRYLPGSLSPRDRLRAYATWCNAVEGHLRHAYQKLSIGSRAQLPAALRSAAPEAAAGPGGAA